MIPESEAHLQDTIQTIYASAEDRPGTRNVIDNETFKVSWTAGDAINVFFGTASSSRFVTEESGSVAKFKGSIDVITGGGEGLDDDTSLWGIYPYNAANSCDGANVTLTLPAVQQPAENTFAPGIWPTVARSKNFYMSFYNVCGAFRFTVYHDNIKKVTLSGNSDEELAGRAKVSFVTEPLVEEIHLEVEGPTAHVGVKVLEIGVHLHRFEARRPSVPLGEHLGQRGLSTPYVSGYGYMHDMV